MILRMQNNNGRAEVLPIGDNRLETGPMGDCVSAVVLADRDANGRYAIVRGFHGAGGVENINFNSLLANLPANGVVLHIFAGSFQRSPYALKQITKIVDGAITSNGINVVPVIHQYSNAEIDRLGNITPLAH